MSLCRNVHREILEKLSEDEDEEVRLLCKDTLKEREDKNYLSLSFS